MKMINIHLQKNCHSSRVGQVTLVFHDSIFSVVGTLHLEGIKTIMASFINQFPMGTLLT